ncbi:MAG TPA: hypothetical protein VER55_10065, partial [Ardenticatenaceae bacterium]|nr:hypothetical protein [Ardenticatenaceae bacterium]
MTTAFDLFLLDIRKSEDILVLARRGADTAIEHIPIDARLAELATFGRRMGGALAGSATRPRETELREFGKNLFAFLFRGSLGDLYHRLPQGPVSLQILSDRREVK